MKARIVLIAIAALVLSIAANGWSGTRHIAVDGPLTAQSPQWVVEHNDADSLAMRVHLPSMRVRDIALNHEDWHALDLSGAARHARPGEPAVPVLSRWIAVPDGAQAKINVAAASPVVVRNVDCAPAQPPAADCTGEPEPDFLLDTSIYNNDRAFPGKLYDVEGPYVVRGLTLLLLRLYPVQVEPANRRATLYADIRVDIDFAGSKGQFFTERRSRHFASLYGQAINHQAFANEAVPPPTGKSPTGAEFVILSAPEFVDAALDLADWKVRQGYDTEVYTTDDTGTSAGQITAWVQNAYDTWDPAPSFILFFGDAEFIPTTYVNSSIGSDLYYVTVDGDDEWADIAHARISVDTLAEAQTRVDNIIQYEREPITDEHFYTHSLHAAYFQHAYNGYAERRFARTSEELYQWLNQFMPDSPFIPERAYVTENYVTPRYWNNDLYQWTAEWWTYDDVDIVPELLRSNGFEWDGNAEDISAAINAGTAFVTHRDHGDTTLWGDPHYTVSDILALTNGQKLPVVWSINCLTGYFDNEHKGDGKADPCFSEAWERHPAGGAVGVLASTRISYSGRNDRMFWGWLDSMWPTYEPVYPDDGANLPEWRMSLVLTYGKMYMSYHYPSDPYRMAGIEEFHWFGDPTFEMWAGVPKTLTVDHLPVIPMGTVSFEVGLNVDDALVALSQNGMLLGKAYSSAGSATVELDAPIDDLADVSLTVTRRQYHPYETDLLVGAMADGVIGLNRPAYMETDTVTVTLSDADFTGDSTKNVTITSDSEPGGETLTLNEIVTDKDATGTFIGEIDLTTGPAAADGLLSVADGDTLYVSYYDATTGSDKSDEAYADTAPPTFAGLTYANAGDARVDLEWDAATDLTAPIAYRIYRAETSGGQNFSVPTATTGDTTFADVGLENFVTYYYVVRAVDGFGHEDTNTVELSDLTIGPIVVWEEDFDDKAGIPDDWEIENITGPNCTWSDENPGNRSSNHWDGVFAIADAGDCGTFTSWEDYLITAPIDLTGFTDSSLVFSHVFKRGDGLFPGHALVDVTTDGGTTWERLVDWKEDRSGLEELDLSLYADNQDAVQLRFGYKQGNMGEYWGIDNLQIIAIPNNDAPTAGFTATPVTGDLPLEVHFTPDTAGVVDTYEWDFGDGDTSTERFPAHVYDTPGLFTVSLTVTGPYGSDTFTADDLVTVSCVEPELDFAGDVTEGYAPLTVNFTDTTDVASGCEPTSVGWGFGDGATSTEANPSHTYNEPGLYTVTLQYDLDYGAGQIRRSKVAYIDVSCALPEPAFSADVTTGEAPLTVQFTDESTTAGEGCAITNWIWYYGMDLDNPAFTTEQNPAITFNTPGEYHVKLMVENDAGQAEHVEMAYITVTEPGADDDDDDSAGDDDDTLPTDDDDDDDDDDTGPTGDDDDDDDDNDSGGCA